VMIMEFEGGKTACFEMTAFTEATSRKTRIFGTKSEVEVDGRFIRVFDFLEMGQTVIDTAGDEDDLAGHEGGDVGVLENFIDAVRMGDPSKILTDAAETLESHLIVFAAERSRLEKRVVTVSP
jgi:predicted dehydrogenase